MHLDLSTSYEVEKITVFVVIQDTETRTQEHWIGPWLQLLSLLVFGVTIQGADIIGQDVPKRIDDLPAERCAMQETSTFEKSIM